MAVDLEDKSDGHDENGDTEIRQGATLSLETLSREDGILARAAQSSNKNRSGLLQSLVTSIDDSKDYRQELKTANFSSPKKALQAVKAIHSLKACGVPNDEIIDAIIALKAGVNMAFVHEVLEALTHTTFTTNYKQSKNRNSNNAKPNSPISG